MKKAAVLTLLLSVMWVSQVLVDTFRCGSKLVGNGDSTVRVLLYCGPPSYKEIISPGIEGPRVEKWYYNCGSSGFLYLLRFVNGVLESIGNEGYGSGQSDCLGAKNR
jgi:hypothetical protein